MSQQLIEAGFYLCNIDEWGIREAESKAVSVSLKLCLTAVWDRNYVPAGATEPTPSWVETPDNLPPMFCDTYVIGKNGQVIPTGMEQVVNAGVWCDDFENYDSAFPPGAHQVVVDVRPELYNGKTTMKPAWLYPASHKPGMGGLAGRADKEKLMQIGAMHGAALRATAASIKKPAGV